MPSQIQTLLGFDFGMKRIGVAVGQTITATATPLETLKANAGEPRWQEIALMIKHWKPDALVVGAPLKLDSSEQMISLAAKHFAEQLRQHFGLPVTFKWMDGILQLKQNSSCMIVVDLKN